MEEWKIKLLRGNVEFVNEEFNIIKGTNLNTLSYNFHKKMPKGAALRELERIQFHLSYWETPYYSKAISSFLSDLDKEKSIILDIGCGDGRFTERLIKLGFNKIVATDTDITPLISLHDFLQKQRIADRVLLIHTGVEDLPLHDESFDAALSIGVLYYLNKEYEFGLKQIVNVLKKGGILINSEPDLEGAIYKSLFFEKLEDTFENYFERIFKEEKGDTPYKFRLFDEKEIIEILSKQGLEFQEKFGLSLFPSILRIMMVRGLISKDVIAEQEYKIRSIMDFLNGNGKLNKHIIWKSRKRPI